MRRLGEQEHSRSRDRSWWSETSCGGLAAAVLLTTSVGHAGEVDVLNARVHCDSDSKCRIVATLRHGDVGWSHYADAFDVLAPDGTLLGTRTLRHPHVHEQPFTRALDAIMLPPDIDSVTIRGRDNVHGAGTRTFSAKVMRPAGAKSPGIAPDAQPAPIRAPETDAHD